MVLNLRILIVGIKAVIGAILAVRIKNSAKGKKSVNRIKVIFRLGCGPANYLNHHTAN